MFPLMGDFPAKPTACPPSAPPSFEPDAGAVRAPLRSSLPMDDPELRDIAREFVDLAQEQIEQLEGALAEADTDGVRRILHWLKGSAGSGGYAPISDTAAAAQQQLRSSGLDPIREVAQDLRHLVDRAREAFDQDTAP
jgi:HPt (histidine-containing phosphotransfer) domain-containing protein